MARASYGAEEVERGLIAYAEANGNARKAARELKADGLKISHGTLREWALRTHLARYERVREEVLPRVREAAAQAHMDLAERNMELEKKMVKQLDSQVEEIPARDMAGAVRNVATAGGIHSDKAERFSGHPLTRAVQDFGGMLREFKELTGVEFKLTTADNGEVVDATVVEDDVVARQLPRERAERA